jgi:hypothetical protein
MAGIIDASDWYADHMEDRSNKADWPLSSAHPQKSAELLEAEHLEEEAWKEYLKAVDEELESGEIKQPDYDRLELARATWLRAASHRDDVARNC